VARFEAELAVLRRAVPAPREQVALVPHDGAHATSGTRFFSPNKHLARFSAPSTQPRNHFPGPPPALSRSRVQLLVLTLAFCCSKVESMRLIEEAAAAAAATEVEVLREELAVARERIETLESELAAALQESGGRRVDVDCPNMTRGAVAQPRSADHSALLGMPAPPAHATPSACDGRDMAVAPRAKSSRKWAPWQTRMPRRSNQHTTSDRAAAACCVRAAMWR
jgi:hypothetical protein